MMNEKII